MVKSTGCKPTRYPLLENLEQEELELEIRNTIKNIGTLLISVNPFLENKETSIFIADNLLKLKRICSIYNGKSGNTKQIYQDYMSHLKNNCEKMYPLIKKRIDKN